MERIQMVIFDIDGVITDGKRYIGRGGAEIKSVSLKDLDAIKQLRDNGYKVGCITGEDTEFSRAFVQMIALDYIKLGYKEKVIALQEIEENFHIPPAAICYIGDGKYDIPVLKAVGLSLCPADAIEEVKNVADIVLKRDGGTGCISESYTLLSKNNRTYIPGNAELEAILNCCLKEHLSVLNDLQRDEGCITRMKIAARMIIDCYQNGGSLFLCGNGGSAADAQHLAAELVGKFCIERQALNAEALTVNTSILTSVANDYDYSMIFARQLEAKAVKGDVLIGITTSGASENILQAFRRSKEMDVGTILMTGKIAEDTPILQYTDCLIDIPSQNTPRIQEMHIMIGHMICEIVEKSVAESLR